MRGRGGVDATGRDDAVDDGWDKDLAVRDYGHDVFGGSGGAD